MGHGAVPRLTAAVIAVVLLVLTAGSAQADTDVSGAISANTTWSPANSPYVLTGTLTVETGATLTIGPGTVVEVTPSNPTYAFDVIGSLDAQGTSDAPITFRSSSSSPTIDDWSGIQLESATSPPLRYLDVEDAGVGVESFADALSIDHSSFVHDNGGIAAPPDGNVAQNVSITDNEVDQARQAIDAEVDVGGTVTIADNTLLRDGSVQPYVIPAVALYAGEEDQPASGVINFTGNLIQGSPGSGITLTPAFSGDWAFNLTDNTIVDSRYNGLAVQPELFSGTGSDITLENNSIYGNTPDLSTAVCGPEIECVNAQAVLDATDNWWGTTDASVIASNIDDSDEGAGQATWQPFLQAPDANAPVPDTTPPLTSIDSSPQALSDQSTAVFSFSSSKPSEATFECALNGGSWVACTSPVSYSHLADGSHTFSVRATDAAGNVDPSPPSDTWTVDTTAPAVTVTEPANGTLTNNTTPTLAGQRGTAAGDLSTVTVHLFAGKSATGTPIQTLIDVGSSPNWSTQPTTLADGTYTAQANQSDQASNVGSSAATTFTIDTVPPKTSIDSAPPAVSGRPSGVFTFSSNKPSGATYECALDGGSWIACTSPVTYSGLSDGTHTFSVRATDAAGNVDPSPAGYTWTVDTTAPAVTLTQPASGTLTNDPIPTLAGERGTAPGDLPTVTVRIYAGTTTGGTPMQTLTDSSTGSGWSVNPTSLVDGTYTAQAGQSDQVGNVGSSATTTFTIDTVLPHTVINSQPPSTTRQNTVTFAFFSSKPSSSFQCSTDQGPWEACTSPFTLTALVDGSHVFAVRAVDAAGNVDASPATWSFVVDTSPPNTTISQGPPNPTSSSSARFVFFSSISGSTFICSLDGSTPAPCQSPQQYQGLPDGVHTFAAIATDPYGRTDPQGATYSWVVGQPLLTTTSIAVTGTRAGSHATKLTIRGQTATLGYTICRQTAGPCAITADLTFRGLKPRKTVDESVRITGLKPGHATLLKFGLTRKLSAALLARKSFNATLIVAIDKGSRRTWRVRLQLRPHRFAGSTDNSSTN